MNEVSVDFRDMRKDSTIVLQLKDVSKKKLPAIGDNVLGKDSSGNTCLGFIERIDHQTSVATVAFDRSTFKSIAIV